MKSINLALQGGGSHGAFTWGVLDALLEDERLLLEGISGTSAGAINAVALAHGFAKRGKNPRQDARDSLANIWRGVTALGTLGSLQDNLMRIFSGGMPADMNPINIFARAMGQVVSPYQTNPLDINPLRRLLEKEIDFAAIGHLAEVKGAPRIYVSATHVRTGKAEIFSAKEITVHAVMASACLPLIFQAVEVKGEHYWDGGYVGNPALSPLISECTTNDLLLVQINPLARNATPQTPADIMDRMNEITFNASLLAQMREIEFINHLLAKGSLDRKQFKDVFLHRIDGGAVLDAYPASSKTSTDPGMIKELFSLGVKNAKIWLNHHFDALGKGSTVDIKRDYLDDMQIGNSSTKSGKAKA